VGRRESERRERRVDPPPVVPAVQSIHVLEQLGLAQDQAVQLRAAGRIDGDRGVDRRQFGFDGRDVGEQAVQHFGDGGVAVQLGELREVAEPGAVLDRDRPGIRRHLALDQLEDGRLPGTVLTDQPDPVTRFQAEEGLPQNLVVVEPNMDVLQPDQAHTDGRSP
jgi:hypothetical protein